MVSKVQIKYLRSLQQKKYRSQYGRFCLENHKILAELLTHNPELVHRVLHVERDSLPANAIVTRCAQLGIPCDAVPSHILKGISSLKTPPGVLAECEVTAACKTSDLESIRRCVYLADIRDPGNLGTIFRTCLWFGVDVLILSEQTVEIWNPKVVHASMGSVFYQRHIRCDLDQIPDQLRQGAYALDMQGESVYDADWSECTTLILGSESHGLLTLKDDPLHKVSIPNRSSGRAESLNAPTALGIALGFWR